MIIVLKPGATDREIEHLDQKIKEIGLTPHLSMGVVRTIVGVIGDERVLLTLSLSAYLGVE